MKEQEIRASLQSEQVEKRLVAVSALLTAAAIDSELLPSVLGDADWRVRKEAVQLFLQRTDSLTHVDYLIKQLSHPENAGLRNAAIEILIGLGSRSLPQLTARLSEPDAEVRKFIVDILGEIGNTTCISNLLALLGDEDENVRYAVIETLGKLKATNAAADLIDLLGKADSGLQFVILDTLALIGTGVAAEKILPYASNPLLRKSVYRCLGRLADAGSIAVLLEGLIDPLRKVREEALFSLAQLLRALPPTITPEVAHNPEIVALLQGYLTQGEGPLKTAACYVSSLFADSDILLLLINLLADEDVQEDVIAAFRRVPPQVFNAIIRTMQLTDASAPGTIYIAGELGYDSIAEIARDGLLSEDPQIRYVSIQALGKISDSHSILAVSNLLTDEENEIREAATTALGLIGGASPDAVFAVIGPLMEKGTIELKRRVVRILGKLPIALVESLILLALKDVDADIRCEALASLNGRCTRRLLGGLSLALTDESVDVRRLAAAALASCPAEQKHSVLAHAFEDNDPWVRMTALRSLSSGSSSETLPLLERGLVDSNGLVVIAALEMLSQVLPAQAVDRLASALTHADAEVVRTAIRLLVNAGQAQPLVIHDNPQVRLFAVKELQLDPAGNWSEILANRLASEEDPEICLAIENALRGGLSQS